MNPIEVVGGPSQTIRKKGLPRGWIVNQPFERDKVALRSKFRRERGDDDLEMLSKIPAMCLHRIL